MFSTDSSGHLTNLDVAVSQTGSDRYGNDTFYFYMDGFNDFWFGFPGSSTFVEFGADAPPTTDNTTISLVSATPLPAALPLFVSGLGAVGLLSMRRKRKTRTA